MNDDSEMMKAIGGKTGAAKWKEIDDLVRRWAQRNPYGANLNRLYNQSVREDLNDKKFATSDSMAGGRLMLSIHPELVNYIEAFYPDFFDHKDNVQKFAKTYKMFAVAEKI